jgi:hypothetical protein
MNTATSRWTSATAVNLALGIWFIVSPFVLVFPGANKVEWNNIIVGILIALVALTGGGWVNIVLGAWQIISPFALGFSSVPSLLWNNIVVGAIVLLVAAFSDRARPIRAGAPPAP